MTAATVTELRFDVTAAIHRAFEASPDATRDDVVDQVMRQLPAAALVELARIQVVRRTALIEAQCAKDTPAPTPAQARPAASSKVSAIRDDWRSKLRAYEFEGALAVRTSLDFATRADLEAAAARHARNAAFLTGVAKALQEHDVTRVQDLPVVVRQRIAEKIPRRAT